MHYYLDLPRRIEYDSVEYILTGQGYNTEANLTLSSQQCKASLYAIWIDYSLKMEEKDSKYISHGITSNESKKEDEYEIRRR